MVEFACTRGSVLGPSAIVAKSADAESSKHRNQKVPQAAPVCEGMFLPSLKACSPEPQEI